MLSIIRTLLQKFIDDIDADNTNLTYQQQCQIIQVLSNVNIGQDNEMNKTQAADYLGVSRATFDNYVRDGFIPKGKQVGKFKELRWYKSDLDIFLMN
jgi:predicted DNA-binding transcriptional regulator AlpA